MPYLPPSGTYAAIPQVLSPSGFPAFVKLPTPLVYRLGGGQFRALVDLSSLKPVGATVRYVDRAGSAGNDGLTAATPWNVATAIAAINAGINGMYTIIQNAGEIQTTTWAQITKSCNWIGAGPGARATNHASTGMTWTAVSGVAGAAGTIYAAPKQSTNQVLDLLNLQTWTDRFGRTHRDFSVYAKMGTNAASQAAALALITGDGQWSTDGTNVYVRPIGAMDLTNATAKTNIRLDQGSTVGIDASGAGVVVYVKGIALEAHTKFGASAGAILIAEDCSLKYNVAGNGTTHDGGHAIHIRCTTSYNFSDGFNYHDTALTNATEFIEIDCVSHHNGMANTAPENNNATTCHDDCRGIRVGGVYGPSTGPTVADVNGAKTWNLGCDSRDSYSATASNRANWVTDTTAEQWLDECSSDGRNLNGGSGTGYNFKTNTSTAKIHLNGFRGASYPTMIEPSSVGVVDYYTPAA